MNTNVGMSIQLRRMLRVATARSFSLIKLPLFRFRFNLSPPLSTITRYASKANFFSLKFLIFLNSLTVLNESVFLFIVESKVPLVGVSQNLHS